MVRPQEHRELGRRKGSEGALKDSRDSLTSQRGFPAARVHKHVVAAAKEGWKTQASNTLKKGLSSVTSAPVRP